MSKKQDMINDLIAHADAGTGVDYDKRYGYQCADVTCYGIYEYFGTRLWGNAIDLLRSAESAGLQVVYGAQYPKAGWFFVKNFVAGDGVNYGHTGLVYEDSDGSTIKTIEQNIDGSALLIRLWDILCRLKRMNQAGSMMTLVGGGVVKTARIQPLNLKQLMEIGSISTITAICMRINGYIIQTAIGTGSTIRAQ